MVHSISYRTTLCLCAMLLCFKAVAQSYVTYNHDATKMNQITVQEIGVGGLTPAFYYTLFCAYVEVRQNTIITNYIGEYQILIKHHINNTSFLFCAISSLFLCFMLLFC